MDFVFAYDAQQRKPTRKNTGSLIAIGGVYVPGESVGPLERALEAYCKEVEFPNGEQFKWSPGKKDTFMKTTLVEDKRVDFYKKLFLIASEHNASAFVIIEDTTRKPAHKQSHSHEEDITALFLERADWICSKGARDGLVIVSTPGGGTAQKERFLAQCLELRKTGTRFSKLDHFPLGVVTVKSSQMKLLQLADVVVSCTTARVAGESGHSPPVFDMIKPIFRQDSSRIGRVGLKIHPLKDIDGERRWQP